MVWVDGEAEGWEWERGRWREEWDGDRKQASGLRVEPDEWIDGGTR